MVNRFINFRAYIKPLNKVYKVKNLFIENKGIEPVDENGSSVSVDGLTNQFYEEEYILMQSTGLEDKNGKEVFEGDIVEIKHELENKITKVYNEVYYDEKKCWFILKNKNEQNNTPCSYSELKFCEVVGNIYENINLIKE